MRCLENAPRSFGVSRLEKDVRFPGKLPQFQFKPGGLMTPTPGEHPTEMYWVKTREQIYSVRYTIDEFGRRRVPGQNEKAPMAALFWGCSFTFGEGLDDQDTLPAFFANRARSVVPYNFGVRGYAPNDMIVRLRSEDTVRGIAQAKGVALYIYLDAHVSRALGYLDNYVWTRTHPLIELDREGRAMHKGTFEEGQPLKDLWLQMLGLSETIRLFKLNWPLLVTDSDLDRFADLVGALKLEMREKFPGFEFVVVFHPLDSHRWGKHFISRFESREIHYLNYTGVKWEDLIGETGRIKVDGHPNGVTNRLLGTQIAEDIQSYYKTRFQ